MKKQLIREVRLLMPSVKLIYLFGSQASSQANDQSDIDIAVLAEHKIDSIKRFDHQETLAIKLKRDVDLVDLLSASTVLQNQIVQHGVCLYGREEVQDSFEMQVLSMYQRLNEDRAEILRDYK